MSNLFGPQESSRSPGQCSPQGRQSRRIPSFGPFRRVNSCHLNGHLVMINDTVELPPHVIHHTVCRHSGFLRVKAIILNSELNEYILRGILLINTQDLREGLPSEPNGYCAVINASMDDSRPPLKQGLEDFKLNQVLRKRHVIFTNSREPFGRKLMCKWIRINKYENVNKRRQRKTHEVALRWLSETEADESHRVSDECLFCEWRLPVYPWANRHADTDEPYTSGDAFTGAGGMMLGAKQASLRCKWCFDQDKDVCNTLQLNFREVEVYQAAADQFHALCGPEHYVDVIHFSPPCQCFSPANTCGGRATNDETNSAAVFSPVPIALKLRPRVCTMEETSGLRTHHPQWFAAALQPFVEAGFSIRWRIMNLADYGASQSRKRLIVFASCPGESLPEFPKPTHFPKGTGLPEHTVIPQCIDHLDPNVHTYHNPSAMPRTDRAPYSAYVPLRSCQTTGGDSMNYHPSGTREFTLREQASLMTFPADFEFPFGQKKGSIMRQIGNAVPPVAATKFMEAVVESLQKSDRNRAATAGGYVYVG